MSADAALARPLLDYLTGGQPPDVAHSWREWRLRPVPSGNNRLWRATAAGADWVVKLAIRDERDRARREDNALNLLGHLTPGVAPQHSLVNALQIICFLGKDTGIILFIRR